MLVVPKKTPGQFRFCIDMRRLNAMTIKNSYTPSCITDMLDKLHGIKLMSIIDLDRVYWQVNVRPCDVYKTEFTFGDLDHCECVRMPMSKQSTKILLFDI